MRPRAACPGAAAARPRRQHPRRAAGSAAVEFVTMAPFVLILTASVWDLRAYVSHRTDLAREVYVLAEVIANEADKPSNPNPIRRTNDPAAPGLVDAFVERFSARGAGALDIAVVKRGSTDRGTSNCADSAAWCPPEVSFRWPPTVADGLWGGGGDCVPTATPPYESTLPKPGTAGYPVFGADRCMLANEDGDTDGDGLCGNGGSTEEAWISRGLGTDAWWVVVDVCLHPGPGTFTGPLIAAGMNALDLGSFTVHARGAWRSIHSLGSCRWCEPP